MAEFIFRGHQELKDVRYLHMRRLSYDVQKRMV